MKKRLQILAVLSLITAAASVANCSAVAGEADSPAATMETGVQALVKIGESSLTVKDLEDSIALRPPPRVREEAVGEEVRRRLEELVLSELLYREALRQGLDKKPEVRQAMRQLLARKLLEQVERPVLEREITEEEIKAAYEAQLDRYSRPEQVRLVDIFFPTGEGEREAQRAKASEVHAKALKLKDSRFGFGELVMAHSDPQGPFPKGDTGFFDREGKPAGIDPLLAKAAFEIEKVGSIAGQLIETPGGFHVAMLVARRDAFHRDLETVRGEIEEHIRRDEHRKVRGEYLMSLRADAEVMIDEQLLLKVAERLREDQKPPPQSKRTQGKAPPALPGEGQ